MNYEHDSIFIFIFFCSNRENEKNAWDHLQVVEGKLQRVFGNRTIFGTNST